MQPIARGSLPIPSRVECWGSLRLSESVGKSQHSTPGSGPSILGRGVALLDRLRMALKVWKIQLVPEPPAFLVNPFAGASRDAGGTFTAPALALPHDTQRHKNRRVHALPGNPARIVPASFRLPSVHRSNFSLCPSLRSASSVSICCSNNPTNKHQRAVSNKQQIVTRRRLWYNC